MFSAVCALIPGEDRANQTLDGALLGIRLRAPEGPCCSPFVTISMGQRVILAAQRS